MEIQMTIEGAQIALLINATSAEQAAEVYQAIEQLLIAMQRENPA